MKPKELLSTQKTSMCRALEVLPLLSQTSPPRNKACMLVVEGSVLSFTTSDSMEQPSLLLFTRCYLVLKGSRDEGSCSLPSWMELEESTISQTNRLDNFRTQQTVTKEDMLEKGFNFFLFT